MRRSLFSFAFGLLAGVALMLVLESPVGFSILGDDAGVALDEARRGAQHVQLEVRVRTALALQKDFDLLGGIAVAADGDEVTLSGTVASEEQRQLAELIAKGVDGVGSIVNRLDVQRADG